VSKKHFKAFRANFVRVYKSFLMNFYKVLEHPSDLKLKILGKNLKELFSNLVRAIAREQLGNLVSKEEGDWEDVEIESPDLFSLLVDFASEVIYRSDANQKVYIKCEVEEVNKTKIKARILGLAADRKIDIKAATYHEGYVKKFDDGWEAVLLFDV